MRILLSTSLLLIVIILNGQTLKVSGTISDILTDKPLPYANIMLVDKAIGTSSESNGYFELILADSLLNDSIIVSYVGYQKHIFCISDNRSDIIKLKPIRFKLNEVLIKPLSTARKQITLNKFKRWKCFVRHAPINNDSSQAWIPCRTSEPTIEALYFPYEEEYAGTRKLKEVVVKVSNYASPPTYFNLRIFRALENISPGNDIVATPIIVEVNETKKPIVIDLEEYDLTIPENGLFIGFELLIIDENKSIIPDKNGSPVLLYSPFLNFFSSKEESVFWIYSKGKWSKSSHSFPLFHKMDRQKYSRPAISLILTD